MMTEDKAGYVTRGRGVSRAICVVLITLSIVLWWTMPRLVAGMDNAASWYESPGLFPTIALLIIVLGGATHLWRQRKIENDAVGEDEIDASASQNTPALLSLVAVLTYAIAVPLIGYAAATLLFVSTMLLLAGLRWGIAAWAGLGAAALLYIIFVLGFHVWFPEPSIVSLMGKAAGP